MSSLCSPLLRSLTCTNGMEILARLRQDPWDPCAQGDLEFLDGELSDPPTDDDVAKPAEAPRTRRRTRPPSPKPRRDLRIRIVYLGTTLVFGPAMDTLECRQEGTRLVRAALEGSRGVPHQVAAVVARALSEIHRNPQCMRVRLDKSCPAVVVFRDFVHSLFP